MQLSSQKLKCYHLKFKFFKIIIKGQSSELETDNSKLETGNWKLPIFANSMSEKVKGKKIFDFSSLKRVFQYASPYKSRVYTSVFFLLFLAVVSPLRPFLIQLTVNDYIRKGVTDNISFREQMAKLIIWITVFQMGLLLIETICRFYFSYITAWLGQTVVKDLRTTVYKKVLGLNLSQFDKTPIGTLTTRTINDIEAINDIFSDGLIPIIADLLSIISDSRIYVLCGLETDIDLHGAISVFNSRYLCF